MSDSNGIAECSGGELDVVAANPGGDTVGVLLGKGDGYFQPQVYYTVGHWTNSQLAVGDFNSDGEQDLVVANDRSNNLSVLLGNGDGTFQPAVN